MIPRCLGSCAKTITSKQLSAKLQPISTSFIPVSSFPSHRGETCRNRHKDTKKDTQDRAVYFNLFSVILPKFGSLFYTTVLIPYKPLCGTKLLGLPVVHHGPKLRKGTVQAPK